MGKKEKHETENKKIEKTTTAVSIGEYNSQETEEIQEEPSGIKTNNTLASLDAILREVQSSQRNWPQQALSAILSRWKQMPRGGWPKVTRYYCDKFQTEISETLFKKTAKEILRNQAGNPTEVRNFNLKDGRKRLKVLDDTFKTCSLKDIAFKGRVKDNFTNVWKELATKKIEDVHPTRKISSLKTDLKLINTLN
ncbi:hypothetical protein NGRA_3396, partial [Nosema granulosis]